MRLSWDTDSWASDANGLTKPGSPAYKSNLVDGFPFGALVGRVGASGEVFLIGQKAVKTALPAGRLAIGQLAEDRVPPFEAWICGAEPLR